MKRKMLKILSFICLTLLIFADQIENNKKRIKQIESQVNQNNQKISKNKSEISNAKIAENNTLAQVKKLDQEIIILQEQYNEAEKRYKEILQQIGINDNNIAADIAEINRNTEIINVNKEDLNSKIKTWDKIRRIRELAKIVGTSNSAQQSKTTHDLKILLNKQLNYIKGVENIKKGVEVKKENEEQIKVENQSKAEKVKEAREDLENKNKKLNIAKNEKNILISQLRGKQKILANENKTIEKNNSNLAAEKKKLNAQIQAIIQRAIREKELALKKAEEEKRKEIEAERIRKEAQAKKGTSTERKTTNLAGEKSTTKQVANSVEVKGTGNLIMPISGSVVVSYGQEKVAGLKSNGIEIRGSLGQAVKAADSGMIIYAGSLNNLGGVVIIDHGGLVTVYGNLSSVSVSKGSKVTKGQVIGTLGKEEISKQPNLYFEIRRGVNIVNPMSYL